MLAFGFSFSLTRVTLSFLFIRLNPIEALNLALLPPHSFECSDILAVNTACVMSLPHAFSFIGLSFTVTFLHSFGGIPLAYRSGDAILVSLSHIMSQPKEIKSSTYLKASTTDYHRWSLVEKTKPDLEQISCHRSIALYHMATRFKNLVCRPCMSDPRPLDQVPEIIPSESRSNLDHWLALVLTDEPQGLRQGLSIKYG